MRTLPRPVLSQLAKRGGLGVGPVTPPRKKSSYYRNRKRYPKHKQSWVAINDERNDECRSKPQGRPYLFIYLLIFSLKLTNIQNLHIQ